MRGAARITLLLLALGFAAQARETPSARPSPKPTGVADQAPPTEPDQAKQDQKNSAPSNSESAPDRPEAPTDDAPIPRPAPEDDFAYSACLLTLHVLGSSYQELPAIQDPEQPGCGIERPVQVSAILPGLRLAGDPVMRCDTARQLALWSRDHLIPAARLLPGHARLTVIEPGSTYQCRDVIGNGEGGKLSEHATGNAFDIMALGFADGTRLEITPRQDTGDMTEAFQAAIRGAACLYFTTVLGPGANAAHDNHLHLDIKARKSGWRLCQ